MSPFHGPENDLAQAVPFDFAHEFGLDDGRNLPEHFPGQNQFRQEILALFEFFADFHHALLAGSQDGQRRLAARDQLRGDGGRVFLPEVHHGFEQFIGANRHIIPLYVSRPDSDGFGGQGLPFKA